MGVFVQYNKIDKILARQFTKIREETQITNIRNERRNLIPDTNEIKRKIRCYEHFMRLLQDKISLFLKKLKYIQLYFSESITSQCNPNHL